MTPLRAAKSGTSAAGASLLSTALLGKLIHGDPAHYFHLTGAGVEKLTGYQPTLNQIIAGSAAAGAAKGIGMDMLMSTKGAQKLRADILRKLGRDPS